MRDFFKKRFGGTVGFSVFGLGLLVSVLNGGCAEKRLSTQVDSDVEVSKYKSYQWVSAESAKFLKLSDPSQIDFITGYSTVVQRPEIESELRGTIDKELRAKGYTVTSSVPDFYVTYYGKAQDEDWVSTWSGRAPSVNNILLIMFPNYDRASAMAYRNGSLLLVVYDAHTKRPVWTGRMSDALKGKEVNLSTVASDLGRLVNEFKSSA